MAFEASLLSVAGTGGGHEALHEDESSRFAGEWRCLSILSAF